MMNLIESGVNCVSASLYSTNISRLSLRRGKHRPTSKWSKCTRIHPILDTKQAHSFLLVVRINIVFGIWNYFMAYMNFLSPFIMVTPFATSWWSITLNLNLTGKFGNAFRMLPSSLVSGMSSHAAIANRFSTTLVNTRVPIGATSKETVLEDEEAQPLELLAAVKLSLLSDVPTSSKSCNVGGTIILIGSTKITLSSSSFP